MIKKGFTIIEVLVVVSIITLLSSIVITSTNIARAKGRDAKKMVEANSVRTAVASYIIDKGTAPHNYECGSVCSQNPARPTIEVEDVSNPTNPTTESGQAYKATMEELVTGGYLTSVPQSGGGAAYVYYDYGKGTPAGAVFGTILDAAKNTTTGVGNSCRPNTSSEGSGAQHLVGDTDNNGSVDMWDYLTLKDNFGRTDCSSSNSYCDGADIDMNGVVDRFDLAFISDNWGGTATVGLKTGNLCDQNSTTDYCICNPY